MGADSGQIDGRDLLGDVLPEEVVFYESNLGQITLPHINTDGQTVTGQNGYHPTASTMTLTAKLGGKEIVFEISGEKYITFDRYLAGVTGHKRKSLILRFLQQYELPNKIVGWTI
jgi:hypothetical protein